MKNPKIEEAIRSWAQDAVSRYKWLTVKFEYNTHRDAYLVSCSPAVSIQNSEDFCQESMEFEEKMALMYGDNAPLFCDDEELFNLSWLAETIKNVEHFSFTNIPTLRRNWNNPSHEDTEITANDYNYALAA